MSMSSWFRNVGLAVVAAATFSCGDDLGTPRVDGGSDGGKAGDAGGNGGVAEAGSKSEAGASEAGAANGTRAVDAIFETGPNSTDTPLAVDTANADSGPDATDVSVSNADVPAAVDAQRDVGVYLDLGSGDGSIGS